MKFVFHMMGIAGEEDTVKQTADEMRNAFDDYDIVASVDPDERFYNIIISVKPGQFDLVMKMFSEQYAIFDSDFRYYHG